ncbi:MAG TPA: bestrophin family ion channel [Cyclobacteriaceae bacterium]|nr:bestrophin family ion channel [Cyclobacteriaceae bacterium]
MINYNPKNWLYLLTHAYSKQVMRTLTPVLLILGVFTLICCYLMITVLELHEAEFKPTIAMHSLLGIVLGLFLVFRTNSAYDRWWEGRRLWGSLVNSTRNMALKLNAYLINDVEERKWFSLMIPNFVIATKETLRHGVHMQELDFPDDAAAKEVEASKHRPNIISSLMYRRVNDLYLKGKITGDQYINIDKEMKDLIDCMGACERIRSTPIPYSYSMYLKKFIFIYIATLPFAFVTLSGYMTIPIVLITAYVILSVELIAEEIEDPFGRDVNDLATDELCGKIRDNVKEIFGIQMHATRAVAEPK